MSSGYIDIPAFGSPSWKNPVALTSQLPLFANNLGDVRLAEDTNTIYVWNGTSWIAVATPGAAISIDGLLGDVTASGPGVVAATLATVNANVGTFGSSTDIPSITVNGKGLITAVTTNTAKTAFTTKTANYTITTSDSIIFIDSSGSAFNLQLPNPSTIGSAGSTRVYRIVDTVGTLSTNNVTLVRFGSEKIEGVAANRLLQTDWGMWQLTTNGTDWFLG